MGDTRYKIQDTKPPTLGEVSPVGDGEGTIR